MRVYIARQAIYERGNQIYAYELLYRSGESNSFDTSLDGDRATCSLLSHVFTIFDLKTLTDGRPAFINFTEGLLQRDLPRILNTREIVIEILEDVPITPKNIEAFERLKKAGYRLSLDDYTGDPLYDPVLPYIDIVKVDFMMVKGSDRLRLARKLKRARVKALAEKVEDDADYEQALAAGYDFFQGYYFEKPVVLEKNSTGNVSASQIRVLKELNKATISYSALTRIIRVDVNLSYKIMHRANTLEYYRGIRIKKLKDALVRMGILELKHWMMLLFFSDSVSKRDENIIRLALVRGIFAEKIACEVENLPYYEDAFTVGMFSLIDVLYNDDMEDLLKDICLSPAAEAALRGEQNLLKDVLDFVVAYEKGRWKEAASILGAQVDMNQVTGYYYEAIRYSNETYNENEAIHGELDGAMKPLFNRVPHGEAASGKTAWRAPSS